MTNHEPSPAHHQPPWYIAESLCEGVYGGERHWAVFADDCRGVVADLEGGLSDKGKANAQFIVRACNAHEDLRRASQDLYDRLQEYLDVSDEQLIEQGHDGLVKAMDDIEAAWHKADGTRPKDANSLAA